ncbi:hypothetical protein WG66_005828 [Moniliophthora roreri]|nr:hypothetical protein WG66_005828 [Moniliophthora roreri]
MPEAPCKWRRKNTRPSPNRGIRKTSQVDKSKAKVSGNSISAADRFDNTPCTTQLQAQLQEAWSAYILNSSASNYTANDLLDLYADQLLNMYTFLNNRTHSTFENSIFVARTDILCTTDT